MKPDIVKTSHSILSRFKLPFRPSTHYEKSPNQCLAPMDPDPLVTGLPLEMMRVSWNVAWYGGMDSLVNNLVTPDRKRDADLE